MSSVCSVIQIHSMSVGNAANGRHVDMDGLSCYWVWVGAVARNDVQAHNTMLPLTVRTKEATFALISLTAEDI